MAYIIAHGTVKGYQKLWIPATCGNELSIITDIRAEFDNTVTMLQKPAGYLLHMASNGVWISIVRLLFDGERASGVGAGFFAFSAFIPLTQVVGGQVIKDVLDRLMEKYISMLSKDFDTQSVGIDWSFVDRASAELDTQCKPCKCHRIHYEKSDRFAYVNVETEEQIVRYLDKPFQPEYGQYKAVFLGTYLQNPTHLPLQTQLNIDLDNEEYEIIWNGNKADYPDANFPLTIRKNQIDSKEIVLKKTYYKDKIIRFSEGERDDPSNTLTLNIPQLESEEFTIKLQFAIPGVAQSIKATANGHTIESEGNQTLKFKGEEVTELYKVHVETNGDYYVKDFSFKPQDYLDKPYPIGVKKTKTIQLQIIDEKGGNVTGRFYSNILVNREKLSYNKGKQSLVTKIFEGDDFRNYSVKLTGNNNYDLDTKPFQQGEIFCVTIRKKKPIHRDPEPRTTLPYDGGDEEETFNLIEELKKGNFSILLLIVGVALIVCAIFFVIFRNDTGGQGTEKEVTSTNVETLETEKKQNKEKEINDELIKILEEQEDKWNSRTLLKSIEGKYDSAKLDSLSYQNKQCVKKISWLWHTRDLLNTKNWNKLNDYIDVNGVNYKRFDKYKAIDQAKCDFLRELILNGNQTANARTKFEKKIDKNFPKKSFSEIKKIWEDCKKTSDKQSPIEKEGEELPRCGLENPAEL